MDWSLIISVISLVGTVCVFIFSEVYSLGSYAKKIDFLEKSVETLIKDAKESREDIIRVQTVLALKHKGIDNIFSMKHSPRMLNSLGNKMFSEMNGETFLSANRDFLFGKIDEIKPQTALDVENAAQWACTAFVNEPLFNPIKNFVYNCPLLKKEDGTEFEFTLSSAGFILGLKLRDLYLDVHPELKA